MSAANNPLVVITGAAGLIGSRVAADLARDYRVVGIDAKAQPEGFPGVAMLECDLTDDASVEAVFARIRREHGTRIASVIHLAAYYDFSGAPSPLYEQLTVRGTSRLLRALQAFQVEQFVFSSSILVMKPAERDEVLTEQSPIEADWDYPQSKVDAEAVIADERGAIPAVILRIAGAYDEDGHSPPITQQIKRIYERELESHLFPGDATRGQSFVHLDDIVTCFRKTIERRRALGPFEVFLIAEPELLPYGDVQDRIGELIHGKEWVTLRVPAPVAKVGAWAKDKLAPEGEKPFIKPWMVDLADAHYPVSIERARGLLGWEPERRLAAALPAMIAGLKRDPIGWYEANKLTMPEALAARAKAAVASRDREGQGLPPGAPDPSIAAAPFTYNPSSWRQRVPICVLAGVATLIASYMACYQWGLIDHVWDPLFGDQSERVLDSDVSERMRAWFRMPDAALGALAYLGDVLFGLAGSTRRWQHRPWLVILFGLDVIPLGIVSAVLVVMQGAVVGSWCFLCLVTALISLALVVLAYDEVWASLTYLARIWRQNRDLGALWDAFCGRPSAEAERAALVLQEAMLCGPA